MMMDLSDVIYDPNWYGSWTISRRGGAYDATGAWVESWTDGTLDAAIHPASDDAMQMLAEGERQLPGIKVYSAQPVGFGDLITWNGEQWRVTRLQDYSEYGFYDSTAVRLLGTTVPGGGAFSLA